MASLEEVLLIPGAPSDAWPRLAASVAELCDARVEGSSGWSGVPVRGLLLSPAPGQLEWSAPSRVRLVVSGIDLRVELVEEPPATRVRVHGEWSDHAREGFAATARLARAVRRALGTAKPASSRLRLAGGDVEPDVRTDRR